ncbi:MAG: S41 family peptidase [Anaerolineaceae bacterium]|nr:S41 family peptidase [Anaerolineaceae bacterium]
MQNKGLRTCLSIVIGVIVLALVFAAGVGVGYFGPKWLGLEPSYASGPYDCPPCTDESTTITTEATDVPVITTETTVTADPSTGTPADQTELFAPFWETWDLLHENYVDQPLDDTELMRGAIEGMLASLGDKHTSYMTPEEFNQANESLTGEYEGIGAYVDVTGDYVEIISPMKGSPAEAAGLQPNDKVIAIDGVDMTGTPGDLVLQQILGPAGTDVTLTINRDGETFDVTITRQHIVVPTVDYEMLDNNIGYIALYTYGDNSTEQLRAALADLLAQNPVGLILDLRDNGGGYLNTAIEVVSEFISDGVVMYEQYGDGTTYNYDAIPGGSATDIPLVVLVNGGTASASEITAGAIQDTGRGVLVGETTYGKGSVQTWIALSDDAGGVRITIARWLTPNGTQISDVGLTPDYEVELTEDDYLNGIDPQLDKAIEVLLDLVN